MHFLTFLKKIASQITAEENFIKEILLNDIFESAITCIKTNPERYLKDIDEIKEIQ